MPRYSAQSGSYVADEWEGIDSPLVTELHLPEHKPVDTGLIYTNGQPIMRLPNPIGFGRDKEW